MLLYQNGRFYGDSVSFCIPNGFHFEDDLTLISEFGLCAWSPQKDHLFSWRLFPHCEGTTVQELQAWFTPEFSFVPLSEITPIQMNGLSGHFVLYKGRRAQYYEARFRLGAGEQFVFLVETRQGDIRQVTASPDFAAALHGIRAREDASSPPLHFFS